MKKNAYFFAMSFALFALSINMTHAQTTNAPAPAPANASATNTNLWQPAQPTTPSPMLKYLRQYQTFVLNTTTMQQKLWAAPNENTNQTTQTIEMPLADGKIYTFEVYNSPIMQPELAEKYQNIKTFIVNNVQNKAINGRIDYSPEGLHALIFTPEGTVYIDPLPSEPNKYVVYYKNDYENPEKRQEWQCAVENTKTTEQTVKKNNVLAPNAQTDTKNPSPEFITHGEVLRTYRLALACTGEYAAAVNATTNAQVLVKVVTSVNRVNALYERDLAVRMILIAKTDTLFFFNASTDPYTNNSGSTMLGQNQNTVTARIGTANYDIGHVFSTGGGGIANLGCVCSSGNKARGVTGSPSPVGDPFDIDFVAHEMGHQFDGNHTFNNSCGGNRNSSTAVEPASGSTIMAYAGVCPPDLQNNSDDHFSAMSLNEITAFITSTGGTCSAQSPTTNSAPVVNAGPNYVIPKSTPFYLKGTATDSDPTQILSYNWEQMDIGPQVAWNAPTGNAPIYRSFPSKTDGYREFPKRANNLSNTTTIGEISSSYARNLIMRLTVRDNRVGAGAFGFDTTKIIVANSGPFAITAPNTATTWAGGSVQTITWNVNATNTAPVNCQNIKILLSRNAGSTFVDTILASTPNDGSETIIVPNIASAQSRLMIAAVGNVFFDINNANFAITQSANNYGVFAPAQTICNGNTNTFDVVVTKIGNFADSVSLSLTNLPAGITATLNKTKILPTDTIQITTQVAAGVAQGAYTFTLSCTTPALNNQNKTININVLSNNLGSITLTNPANNATNTSGNLNYQWASIPGANYRLQVATDTLFTPNSLVINRQNLTTNNLQSALAANPNTTYYWRVQPTSTCGTGTYSPIYTFTTSTESCKQYNRSSTTAVNFPSGFPSVVNSTIVISDSLRIQDVNVYLKGNHSRIKDMQAYLISPAGTIVTLFRANACPSGVANYDIRFDDDATAALPCPPISTSNARPKTSLTDLNGEWAMGTWTLRLIDSVGLGSQNANLQDWNLTMCASCTNGINIVKRSNDTTVCAGNIITLRAQAYSSAPLTYQWLKNNTIVAGASTKNLSVAQTGNYTCVATNGCGADTTATINVNVLPLPTPTITQSNDTLTTQTADTYLWHRFSQPIPAATSQWYIPTVSGEYQVVTTQNGCTSLLSNTYYFAAISTNDLTKTQVLRIYPNPAQGSINIQIPDGSLHQNLVIYDVLGKKMIYLPTTNAPYPSINVEVGTWAKGVYLAQIGNARSSFVVD